MVYLIGMFVFLIYKNFIIIKLIIINWRILLKRFSRSYWYGCFIYIIDVVFNQYDMDPV